MYSIHRLSIAILAIIALTMLLITIGGCRSLRTSSGDAQIVPAAQFVIGSTLLHTYPVAYTPQKQAALYRKLQAVTTTNTSGALAYLEAIRNDPETAKQLCDTMHVIITPRPDTAVNQK